MNFKLLMLFTAFGASACVWQSSVTEMQEGTFKVSSTASPSRGGETEARDQASKLADKHCISLNRQSLVLEVITSTRWPNNSVATITFQCQ